MISLIVPVFNERFTIQELLRRVCSVGIPKQIIIVDDCSTDGTREILKTLESRRPDWAGSTDLNTFRFIYHARNSGKGSAIRSAVPHATEPITLIQDADLEYDPNDYPRLIEPILKGYADVVYGSRFTGNCQRVLYFWHSVGNKVLSLLSNMFTDLNLSDMEVGYKAFRTEIIKHIPIRSERFGFEPEITAKVSKLKCRIYEVPINYHARTYAQGKKIGLSDAIQAFYVVFKYWLIDDLHDYQKSPYKPLLLMESEGDYNRWIAEQILPHLGNSVLEVGAGVGNLVYYMLDRSQLIITDSDPLIVNRLRQRFSIYQNIEIALLDIASKPSFAQLPSKKGIDTIVMVNVLEHLENDEEALRNCYAHLPSGGVLILWAPAHSKLYNALDKTLGRFRRYTIGQLTHLCRSAGFEICSSHYLNMLGALGWFISGTLLRWRGVDSRQIGLFNLLIPLLRLGAKIKVPFGLSLLLIAKKK
ncbi:MAG TPA: glycosyltransferase [Elusimicrobiota bacterium]|nr:glycosyltransferase [Elusimicrobiota bacterium]